MSTMPQVNEYFDGAVKSLTLHDKGRRATVGVMEPGSYEFGTSQHETVRVIVGTMEARLPGESEFKAYAPGSEFQVPANVKFDVRMAEQVAYLCYYD
ncbi:MAG: hypothetical protein RLZZ303_1053 [Candidatus Hydrogenedentota bacterium]|jgi:uncharacterized protein YaiE (UPF0345 family)